MGKRDKAIAAPVPNDHRDTYLGGIEAPVPSTDHVVVDHRFRCGLLAAKPKRPQAQAGEDRARAAGAERNQGDPVAKACARPGAVRWAEWTHGGERGDAIWQSPGAGDRIWSAG